jgi:hypothetical protein
MGDAAIIFPPLLPLLLRLPLLPLLPLPPPPPQQEHDMRISRRLMFTPLSKLSIWDTGDLAFLEDGVTEVFFHIPTEQEFVEGLRLPDSVRKVTLYLKDVAPEHHRDLIYAFLHRHPNLSMVTSLAFDVGRAKKYVLQNGRLICL